MAKKKPKTQEWTFLEEVKKKLPALYAQAASLQPFDDVIHTQWANKEEAHFGIGIQDGGGAWPSGSYDTYGARIYADKVLLFQDTYLPNKDGDTDCFREEHVTDMAGLWTYLRQLPRPISSFGKWTGGK
jgi:hypothetical protein